MREKKCMKGKTIFLSVIFLVISICFINPIWSQDLEIHVINVGQGDSYLIKSPTGTALLIDAGNNGKGTSVVIPYLTSLGISSLDYIVATHYHSDHIGGIDEVVDGLGGISNINQAVFDRGGNYSTGTYTDYAASVTTKRKKISPGDVISLGGFSFLTCIAANGKIQNQYVYTGNDENHLSVVLRLDYCDFQMYFSGDSGTSIEQNLGFYAQDMDVYKVGHHGSNTASSLSFLNILLPEVSTISVGSNGYGHPTAATITKLVNINSYIYQTEPGNNQPPSGYGEVANGSFKIVTNGTSYTVSGSNLTSTPYTTDSSYFPCQGITVVSPNGGDGLGWSRTKRITWTSSGLSKNLYIILQQDGANKALIAKGLNPALGSYTWKVGECIKGAVDVGDNYKILIKQKNSIIKDNSDDFFTICNPSLTVTSPNGGESLEMDDEVNITWNHCGLTGLLYIILQQDGSSVALIAKQVDPDLRSYRWTVGECIKGKVLPGSNFKIFIKEKRSSVKDKSDGTFSIGTGL